MDDKEIMKRIGELDEEEHRLLESAELAQGLDQAERERMHKLHVEIDQLWDLIRQRRGRRHAGLDPEGAKLRSASIVENYQQ